MCVGFLPLSCAVPVSGYSCLPFSDIGQEIGGSRESRGAGDVDLAWFLISIWSTWSTWSAVINRTSRADFGHFSFFSVGLRPQKATH